MSLKRRIEEEEDEHGEGKRIKLNFTRKEPSKKGDLQKDNQTGFHRGSIKGLKLKGQGQSQNMRHNKQRM